MSEPERTDEANEPHESNGSSAEAPTPAAPPATPGPSPTAPGSAGPLHAARQAFEALASLRLTLALLAFSMVLVFAGTWAQRELGIWTVLDTYFRAWVVHVSFWGIYLPGGYVIGGLMLANLLAAHALRWRANRKRAGVILIHAGLVLLLTGELVTDLFAVESSMEITEGETGTYAYDVREAELVVIDPSHSDHDDLVIAVPVGKLFDGSRITHSLLPCTVEVERYYPNSEVLRTEDPGADRDAPAVTAGQALGLVAVPLAPATGVGDQRVDRPSAYVRLLDGDRELGRVLVSTWFQYQAPQSVNVGGKTYQLELRFRRYYKPYKIKLLDFTHDRYTGTSIPKNFASRIVLSDVEQGVDREVVISMNNPLRYAGETFYQSAFKNDDRTTVLQVVRNPGWTIPYIAVLISALGMLLQFGATLLRTVKKRKAKAQAAAAPPPSRVARGALYAGAGVALLVLTPSLFRSAGPRAPFDFADAATLPASFRGRVKPLDTVAKNCLRELAARERIAEHDLDALPWLWELMARPALARGRHCFRVDHPHLKATLELEESRKLFSYDELLPRRTWLFQQAQAADAIPSKDRDAFQRVVLRLASAISTFEGLAGQRLLHLIPPTAQGADWTTLPEGREHPVGAAWNGMISAYGRNDPAGFNRELHVALLQLGLEQPGALSKSRLEVRFTTADPFTHCAVLYLLAFLLCCASWAGAPRVLLRAALGITLVTLVAHTLGLGARIYLMGRPPVTNLYSSAVFIGWGAVLFSLAVERVQRDGLALFASTATAALSLLIADRLALEGDTMAVLQAVLDTNFWLATHVVVITLGYAACFLAGLLGISFVVRGLFFQGLDREGARRLASTIYGVVCFATLFSFVGTILGGIWADQSWGRFWGWDPKENGALLIVLYNALILHARWSGLARQRGLALLAIGGNVVTAWSWFGTNLLGVGLHAYGFMEGRLFWLLVFVGSQLALIGAGLIPVTAWRSRAAFLKPGPARNPLPDKQ
ncbi:MAG: cytochrome c biogenesis protein CcsA [Planctomycetes bacterium]|nr:cytochrome c biogenesis protein CcsA [Planctomycetota bacterium]